MRWTRNVAAPSQVVLPHLWNHQSTHLPQCSGWRTLNMLKQELQLGKVGINMLGHRTAELRHVDPNRKNPPAVAAMGL